MWLADDISFRRSALEITEITLDFVESKLLKKISEGDNTAIIFYLKCKGKSRGYIDRQIIDQNITMNEPVKLNIILPEQPEKLEGGPDKMIEI
jgi:hypothetical protein